MILKKKKLSEETQIHIGIMDLLRYRARKDVIYWHIANERHTSLWRGYELKQMGVLAGVPDIQVIIPNQFGPIIGFMEVKTPKGVVKDNQKHLLTLLTGAGCRTAVVRSITDAEKVLNLWGALR